MKGLNKAGFSEHDYREVDVTLDVPSTNLKDITGTQVSLLPEQESVDTLDPHKLDTNWEAKVVTAIQNEGMIGDALQQLQMDELATIKAQAQAQSRAYERSSTTKHWRRLST